MTKSIEVDRPTFIRYVDAISYRDDDEKEAREFGCVNVRHCYDKAKLEFARYFVVLEDDIPVATIVLQRDGQLVFFISKDVKRPVALVKALRRLAKKTVKCCGPITTKTANWYKEALRFNEVIGFKLYKIRDRSQIWVFGYEPLEGMHGRRQRKNV